MTSRPGRRLVETFARLCPVRSTRPGLKETGDPVPGSVELVVASVTRDEFLHQVRTRERRRDRWLADVNRQHSHPAPPAAVGSLYHWWPTRGCVDSLYPSRRVSGSRNREACLIQQTDAPDLDPGQPSSAPSRLQHLSPACSKIIAAVKASILKPRFTTSRPSMSHCGTGSAAVRIRWTATPKPASESF